MTPSRDIGRLLDIMAALRTPDTGCPWDIEQDFSSIAPYTIEEAYEVADAIERGDLDDLQDELGDLLLQVVFHSRMAEEQGAFAFGDVVQAITEKLIRRHPHVFGDARDLSPDEVKAVWASIKAEERRLKAARRPLPSLASAPESVLDGVPRNMPALARAEKLQSKAARVGFDWADTTDVIAKIREELDEVEQALAAGEKAAVREEIGDLIFAVANLARHLGVDPETATHATNAKFTQRFKYIEQNIEKTGKALADSTLDEMEALWQEAKRQSVEAASASG
ncbi:nucleoside triphosphate pyrophosphohydrolase [Pseudochelatococcus sp. B33]